MVFLTSDNKFYYWHQGTTSWKLLEGDGEWTDNGTYLSPTDGISKDVAIGGNNNPRAKLTIRTDGEENLYLQNSSVQDTIMYGIVNNLSNATTRAGSYTMGLYNLINNTNNGRSYGVYNRLLGDSDGFFYGTDNVLVGSGDGFQSGTSNSISNSGDGTHFGVYSSLSGSGSGIKYGNYNTINSSSDSAHYGENNLLTGSGSGTHYGVSSILGGEGDGTQYASYNLINNTGTGDHTGVSNNLSGTGSGVQIGMRSTINNSGDSFHIGIWNDIGGTGNGPHTAVYNSLSGDGTGVQSGTYNLLSGLGTGVKYGTYNKIETSAGGQHYGIYSEALKTGSFAGYFLGKVSIGTTTSNNYFLPASRGSNGQVMQTDGSGNVSWATPISSDTSPAWFNEGTTTNATTTSSDIIRTGNIGLGVTNANSSIDITDDRGVTAINIATDDTSSFANTNSYGIKMNLNNDNSTFASGDTYAIENTVEVLTGAGYGIKNNVTSHSGASPTVYGSYQNIQSNAVGSAIGYGTYNTVDGNFFTSYGSYNRILGAGYGVYSSATDASAYAGYFLGQFSIGTTTSNNYIMPASRGTNGQVMRTDGSGNVSWADTNSFGVQKIDDLSDGKSDNDGSNNGSSVFLGAGAGGQDDLTHNKNIGIGYTAIFGNQDGEENVAIGYESQLLGNTGDGNISIGIQTLYNNYGDNNIAIGRGAHIGNGDTASNNISIGTGAGNAIGTVGPNIPNGNILIGTSANPFDNSGSNQINIGDFLYANTINGGSVGGYFSGNLGVGFWNPSSTLHIGGDFRMDYPSNGNHWRMYIDAVNDYNFEYNGALKSYIQDTDGSYNIFSDKKLKNNIYKMDAETISKVMQLNPVNYTYKNDITRRNQNGFIAQEVQELFPELVSEKKNEHGESFLTLRYDAFGVLAIKTIQEQQKEIETLKEEISELKKLEARISALENKN